LNIDFKCKAHCLNHATVVPFSLQREAREQIEEIVKNYILEISHSPYVNPLTIIETKDKPVRICVDARQVNKQMVPDTAKTPPS